MGSSGKMTNTNNNMMTMRTMLTFLLFSILPSQGIG